MKSQSFTQWLTMAQELELSEYATIQHDLQGTEEDSGAYEQSGRSSQLRIIYNSKRFISNQHCLIGHNDCLLCFL